MVRLTKAMKELLEDTRVGAGLLRLYGRHELSAYVEAAVDLWVAGVLELIACDQSSADFQFTREGEELARVVCAA